MNVAEEFRTEGREEGRVVGREEIRAAHAKKMLAKGFPLEDVIEITHLSRKELEEVMRSQKLTSSNPRPIIKTKSSETP